MFSAYMLDPEHGWHAVHRLPLGSAIRQCKEYRSRHAGGLVALVPDSVAPEPYFALADACDNSDELPKVWINPEWPRIFGLA